MVHASALAGILNPRWKCQAIHYLKVNRFPALRAALSSQECLASDMLASN